MSLHRSMLYFKHKLLLPCFVPKRFRFKKKWATTRAQRSPAEHALAYFDSYYKPVYGDLWHSMRISLLSQQKYCALINNFANVEETVTDLLSDGSDDIVSIAKRTKLAVDENSKEDESDVTVTRITSHGSDAETESMVNDSTDIYSFVPVKRITSEKEMLMQQEFEQAFYNPKQSSGSFEVNVVKTGRVTLPYHLQALAFDRGDITRFQPAKMDSKFGLLGYYLMDAASILPVIALDLHPGCNVLDLCAAPGGKSLTMLQTMLPGSLHCVDNSYSRIGRLKDVLKWYLPPTYRKDNMVQVHKTNGALYCEDVQSQYDRVLVDVPCNTDRHVLLNEDNNIFRPNRVKERLELKNTQTKLLFGGIKACRPGGVIVYSTCTLSHAQNDGIIHAVLEKIWQETDMEVVVEDVSVVREIFADSFNFYNECRFGQLVIPNLMANFGPMYFCKLRRIS